MSSEKPVQSTQELAAGLYDLYDEEIKEVAEIVAMLTMKYSHRPNTAKNLDELRDEATSRLADIGVIATIDPVPALRGEPPIIDILGKVRTDPVHKHGLDHGRKKFEVQASKERDEDFYGQKERINPKSKAAKTKTKKNVQK